MNFVCGNLVRINCVLIYASSLIGQTAILKLTVAFLKHMNACQASRSRTFTQDVKAYGLFIFFQLLNFKKFNFLYIFSSVQILLATHLFEWRCFFLHNVAYSCFTFSFFHLYLVSGKFLAPHLSWVVAKIWRHYRWAWPCIGFFGIPNLHTLPVWHLFTLFRFVPFTDITFVFVCLFCTRPPFSGHFDFFFSFSDLFAFRSSFCLLFFLTLNHWTFAVFRLGSRLFLFQKLQDFEHRQTMQLAGFSSHAKIHPIQLLWSSPPSWSFSPSFVESLLFCQFWINCNPLSSATDF